MGLLEVLEWKLPVRPRTLVLVNLSAFVCVYQTQIPPNTSRMGVLPYHFFLLIILFHLGGGGGSNPCFKKMSYFINCIFSTKCSKQRRCPGGQRALNNDKKKCRIGTAGQETLLWPNSWLVNGLQGRQVFLSGTVRSGEAVLVQRCPSKGEL